MSNQGQPRVAVIGGGVIGVSSAYHLARRGAKVSLITERALASGASGRSLSWLNSAAVRSEHYHRLRMIGIDRYRTLFALAPDQNWLRFDGGLNWYPADQVDVQMLIHDYQLGHGYDSHVLTSEEVEARVPGVNPASVPARGAIWNPGEGWVDLPSLINYLANALVGLGGDVITDAGPASVLTTGGRINGVLMEGNQRIEVDAALIATGPNVPAMASQFGATIPDATTLAVLIKTQPVETQLRAVLNTPRASLRPTPNGGLAIDSDWTQPHIEVRSDRTYRVPATIIEQLLTEASRLLIGTPRLTAAFQGIGPKPVPVDDEPVLGKLGDIDGLYVAFTHSGATLALIIGEMLAYEITTGQPHPLIAPYSPRRFAR